MTKEEPEIIKQGYQPIHSKNASVIPPNAGSHVRMKGKGYTWEDLDKAWWEGFDNAKNKMGKRIAELDKAKELLRECRKYHFHPEVTEYPYNDVEAFLKE